MANCSGQAVYNGFYLLGRVGVGVFAMAVGMFMVTMVVGLVLMAFVLMLMFLGPGVVMLMGVYVRMHMAVLFAVVGVDVFMYVLMRMGVHVCIHAGRVECFIIFRHENTSLKRKRFLNIC